MPPPFLINSKFIKYENETYLPMENLAKIRWWIVLKIEIELDQLYPSVNYVLNLKNCKPCLSSLCHGVKNNFVLLEKLDECQRLTVPLKKFILKHLSKEKYLYENEKHVNDEKCLCTFIQFYLECLFAVKKRIVNCYNQPRWRLTVQHGDLLQYFV